MSHHFIQDKAGELPRRKTDGASQFIGNSLQNSVVLESLTFPPRAGVLVPKTQIFFLQHIPISLVFAYGIDGEKRGLEGFPQRAILNPQGQDPIILPENFGASSCIQYLFLLKQKKQYWMQSSLRDAVREHPPLTIPTL
ncbi:hypothetical protein [Nostoc sp. JL33]|uniref:hypothetical protein n=1 Tax=Nostoc sp. JL33 TaxID=2815396 RepID=UPI0025F10090|nr:hypothetical protein [Nostoc sp. JL33]MBN3872811.1 hypothetical protein [Nostoc sp. JL33]